jgi:hypothetical protein
VVVHGSHFGVCPKKLRLTVFRFTGQNLIFFLILHSSLISVRLTYFLLVTIDVVGWIVVGKRKAYYDSYSFATISLHILAELDSGLFERV